MSAVKKTPRRRRVQFTFRARPDSRVFVAGTFNEWAPTRHRLRPKGDVLCTSVLLERGRHEYKFVVNGTWCVDPDCSQSVPDGFGAINSVIEVN